MINYDDALSLLLSTLSLDLAIEKEPLLRGVGRVLAQDCRANYNAPLFDNSAMDGYALCDPKTELTTFKIVGRVMTGEASMLELKSGEAVRIFTGAKIPKGTTSVVMQEQVYSEADTITLNTISIAGDHIRYHGEEISKGNILFPKGHSLDPAAIALCASQGINQVCVYERPKITVFSTGDELVEPWEALGESQIFDANRYQLLAWLSQIVVPEDGGILVDQYEGVKKALLEASEVNHLIILSGGASVGEADFVGKAIANIGELHAWKLAIKPGKPFGWGKINDCIVIMLPGNPVATYVTYYMLVYPLLRKFLGLNPQLPSMSALLAFDHNKKQPRREFLRGCYSQNSRGEMVVTQVIQQGSAMLSGLSYANCLIALPENQMLPKGSKVTIYPLPKESVN